MTVSGLASVATFNSAMNDEPDVQMNMAVNSQGLPLVSVPEAVGVEKSQESVDLSKSELRSMDKQIRTRRDAQMFLGHGSINNVTTLFKEVADEQFAVDVNVDVDLTRESTPEATIRKMRNILVAGSSVASPTKKDIATNLMAMSIMTDARNEMNHAVKNEAFGFPRVTGARGTDFSMNMGTDNFAAGTHTDSMSMSFRTNNRLTGLLVNTVA
mgnify:CR=1 FL=1